MKLDISYYNDSLLRAIKAHDSELGEKVYQEFLSNQNSDWTLQDIFSVNSKVAIIKMKQGKISEAEEIVRELISQSRFFQNNDYSALSYNLLAANFEIQHKINEATDAAKQAISMVAGTNSFAELDCRNTLLRLYCKINDLVKAEELFNQIIHATQNIYILRKAYYNYALALKIATPSISAQMFRETIIRFTEFENSNTIGYCYLNLYGLSIDKDQKLANLYQALQIFEANGNKQYVKLTCRYLEQLGDA